MLIKGMNTSLQILLRRYLYQFLKWACSTSHRETNRGVVQCGSKGESVLSTCTDTGTGGFRRLARWVWYLVKSRVGGGDDAWGRCPRPGTRWKIVWSDPIG